MTETQSEVPVDAFGGPESEDLAEAENAGATTTSMVEP